VIEESVTWFNLVLANKETEIEGLYGLLFACDPHWMSMVTFISPESGVTGFLCKHYVIFLATGLVHPTVVGQKASNSKRITSGWTTESVIVISRNSGSFHDEPFGR
jgi:hypothetical protein